jgi:hypothetical protein
MQVGFGCTGHYFHQPSGLNLPMYRAYSPNLGRWISLSGTPTHPTRKSKSSSGEKT